jgi:WD40 repeat protein
MDVKGEIFNMVHLCNDLVLSICQSPDNSNCLYFGKGSGNLNAFDERAGKISSTWQLHHDSISSIDFNPENTYMLATSSLDNTACVWDIRNMKMRKAQSLKVVEHKMCVHSAYFSPSGSILATTRSAFYGHFSNIHILHPSVA